MAPSTIDIFSKQFLKQTIIVLASKYNFSKDEAFEFINTPKKIKNHKGISSKVEIISVEDTDEENE